jgi:Na+/melibiose symporter-like transporter
MLTYWGHFRLSKGYEGNGIMTPKKPLTFGEMGRAIIANPHLIPVMVADMTSTLVTFLLPGLMVYMYEYDIGFIFTILFNAIQFNPDVGATPELRAGFINAYSLVNCIIPLMGFVAIMFFYKLSPDIIKKAAAEIETRTGKKANESSLDDTTD